MLTTRHVNESATSNLMFLAVSSVSLYIYIFFYWATHIKYMYIILEKKNIFAEVGPLAPNPPLLYVCKVLLGCDFNLIIKCSRH